MGNVCDTSNGKQPSAAAAAAAEGRNEDAKKQPAAPDTVIRQPSQHGSGAVHEHAEIQRAATPCAARRDADDDEDYQIVRVLLLGAAESGKTTILEQIRQNFSEAELFHRKAFIYNTILRNVRILVARARSVNAAYANEDSNRAAELILAQDETQYGHFTPEIEKAICAVWRDPTIQRIYAKRSEINLNDSTKYFLDNFETINQIDFRPTGKDLIMSYVPTVGVQNIIFQTNNRSIQLFDMGGQRIDRRKWATMYDGIDAIFFCLAVSEYDQIMDEDGVTVWPSLSSPFQNRLTDALTLLEKISQEEKFAETPIFLFLNEIDVFEEKLSVFPLENFQPEYSGKSVNDALDFIEQLASQKVKGHRENYVFR